MKKRKIVVGILALIFAVTMFFGVAAAAGEGTETDPLVTLSYIKEVFEEHVLDLLGRQLDEQTQQLRDELEDRVSALEEKYSAAAPAGGFSTYDVVTLTDGQTMICSRGTEIMLRVGTAVVTAGDTPGLVDTSTTDNLDDGQELIKNHMYMVTINSHGIMARGIVKVIARGEYTIN